MKDVYSCLIEYQAKSDKELQENFIEYREKFIEISKEYFGKKEYQSLTFRNMILSHNELFYRGLFSYMEMKNRKLTVDNLYGYFNTDMLTNSLSLFYLYISSCEVKTASGNYEGNKKVDKSLLIGLFDVELCNHILFEENFLIIMNRIRYLDNLLENKSSIVPILMEYLHNQGIIGKQLIMEFKLKK